jgi:hypothetical protein
MRRVYPDYTVEHFYAPTVQANSMVVIGRADIRLCETKPVESLVLPKYQMYENDFYALFLRANIAQWHGIQDLIGKRVVWREGYYSTLDFSVPVDFVEVRSGESALQMLIHDRADFYIDDHNLIEESFDIAKESYTEERFGLEVVGARKYYPLFANSPRGQLLKKQYESGIERLYREGVLQEIYERWNFRTPRFEFHGSKK